MALDQATKTLVDSRLAIGESVSVIGDVLRITHVRNDGAAFGMLQGLGGLLALFALVGIAVFISVVVRDPNPVTTYGAAFVAVQLILLLSPAIVGVSVTTQPPAGCVPVMVTTAVVAVRATWFAKRGVGRTKPGAT